jgi:hypothetical protein
MGARVAKALAGVVGWVKGLFGGKGATQIGAGNQSVAGSTAGANSPILAAGRDINVQLQAALSDDPDPDIFAELEEEIPDLLHDLRETLAKHPLFRDLVVLETKDIGYGWPGEHLRLSDDELPGARQKVAVLVNHGLVTVIKDDFAYKLTERLVRYLKASRRPKPD